MFPRKYSITKLRAPVLRAAYDSVVLEGLPPITTGFGLLYAVFAVGHFVLLPAALARPLIFTAIVVSILLLLLRFLVTSKRLPLRWVHPTATAMSLVVMFSILQHTHLSGEPRQTTNLMLLTVGAGFFLLASNWFLFFLLTALGGWTLVAHLSAPSSEWMHYRFGMLTAIVLSSVVHIARRRTLRRVEVLRAHEQIQRSEIEHARDTALEATRLKSEFLTNISHEIRTPMHGILGMTNMLRDTPLNHKQRGYAEAIRSCGDYLLSLINDLLDLSKIEAGKLHLDSFDFDLRRVIDESAAMLRPRAEAKGLRFAVKVGAGVPMTVRGDARRIRQVLVNLLGNAIKFTEHGAVELSIEQVEATETHARVRCSISDTGIGIPHELRGKLFKPFTQADGSTTRRYGGTGLGLAISKQIIEAMRGEIGVETARDIGRLDGNQNAADTLADGGSVFWFTLLLELRCSGADIAQDALTEEKKITPALDGWSVSGDSKVWDELGKPDELSASDAWSGNGDAPLAPEAASSLRRILVVDDNGINQQIIKHYVERLGFTAVVASNSVEALAMFGRESSALVLMDCQMPEMDGLSVTREIRRLEEVMPDSTGREGRTTIIAMTAHAMPHERQRCLAAGMDDYLSKPIDSTQLEAAIRRHFAITTQALPETAHPHRYGIHQPYERLDEREPSGAVERSAGFSDELIDLFIEDTRMRLAAVRDRIDEHDGVMARREVHALIGSCGIYGASQMAHIASALIADIAADSFAAALVTLAELESEFIRLSSTLRDTELTPK